MTNVKKTTDPSIVRRRKRRNPEYDDLPMKQSKLIKRILIFALVLIMPAVLWGITGLIGLNDNLDFDTYENRNKHEFAEDTTLGNSKISFKVLSTDNNTALKGTLSL